MTTCEHLTFDRYILDPQEFGKMSASEGESQRLQKYNSDEAVTQLTCRSLIANFTKIFFKKKKYIVCYKNPNFLI